jgi:regulatory protein
MRLGKRWSAPARSTALPSKNPSDKTPFAAGLRRLACRPYSVAELRHALERKFGASEELDAAIARLRELGYLDDRKFAEQQAYSLAQNKTFGPARIRRELQAKLVDYKHIDAAIAQAFQATSAHDLLEQALAKKLRGLRLPLTRSRYHSLCQALARLGFSSGDIIRALRARPELAPVAEEVEPVDLEENGESEQKF